MKVFVVTLLLAVAGVSADGQRGRGSSGLSQGYGAPQRNGGASQSYGAPQGNGGASQSYGAPQGNAGQSYGGQQNDYSAEESFPPQPYSFDYNVQDDQGNDYGHKEESDGSRVEGQYRVLLPDSRVQTVTYYVEGDSGFVADVQYEGEAQFPEDSQNGQYGSANAGYNAPAASANAGYNAPAASANAGYNANAGFGAGGASGSRYSQSGAAAPSSGYGAPSSGSRSQSSSYGSSY